MLNALFGLLAAVKNYVEGILASFPGSSTALLTLVATLAAKFGFSVTTGQLAAIVSAAALIIGILVHHSATAVELRAAKASKSR